MKKLVRFSDLKAAGIVSNWPTLLRWIDKEGFPAGLKMGPNSRAWIEEDVDSWIAKRAERDQPAAA